MAAVHASLDQVARSRPDIRHDELEALERPGRYGNETGADGD